MAAYAITDTVGAKSLDLLLIGMPATMLTLMFPGWSFSFLAWVALVPLIFQVYRSGYAKGVFSAFCTGLIFYSCHLSWTLQLDKINFFSFFLFGVYLASYFGLFAGLAKYFHTRFPPWDAFTFPSLWVSLEYLKIHCGFLSFPPGILGYSQYKVLPVASLAEYTGVLGVSFLIVAVNAAIASMAWQYLKARTSYQICAPHFTHGSLLLGAALLLLAAVTVLKTTGDESVRRELSIDIALVQGNAVADEKTGYENYLFKVLPIYENLTAQAAKSGASLVIWPSSSVPGVLPVDRKMAALVGGVAKREGVHLLIGASGVDKFNTEQIRLREVTTSAFLFSPSGSIVARYDKIRLLPFDEYFPARDLIPWPSWLGDQTQKDYFPGKKLTQFTAGMARFGVQICFENMFPNQIRKLVSNGADFIISQNNDLWTKSTAAQYQLLAYSVFRAIENRVPVIRSSANGVSCVIDSSGRIVKSVKDAAGKEYNIAGFSTAKVVIGNHRSFYNRFGDIFCLTSLICILLLGIYGFSKKINLEIRPIKR